MFLIKEDCTMQDMFCFTALANTITNTMYTDLSVSGAISVRSFKKLQYIFVAYIYVLNAIIVRPMQSRTDASMIVIFTEVFAILHSCDYQPALNIIDNECSKAGETCISTKKMTIQLVPPQDHRVNAAQHAIAMFKENFVSTLTTANMICPLQLWDEFIQQVKLTLNLLCFS
jgi:hypothetical protein